MADPYPNIRIALETGRVWEAVKITKDILKDLRNIPMTIGVTGESGSGKSSLVDALRGLDQGDARAAKTGVKETTAMVPMEYSHPDNPKVKLWDLPALLPGMAPAQYLDQMELEKFDVFIIVCSERFTELDAKLGLEIQRRRKKVYFVRSKVDQDISNVMSEFNQEKTLRIIRDDCENGLEIQGVASPRVFLVSSFQKSDFEFCELEKTMKDDMCVREREGLIQTVLSYHQEIIEQKKKDLSGTIAGRVTGAVFAGIVPFLNLHVNRKIVGNFAVDCLEKLNLSEQSLEKLSEECDVSVLDLKNAMKLCLSPDPRETNAFVVFGAFTVFGIPANMILSGGSLSEKLPEILDVIAADAQNVLDVALRSL